MTNLERQDNGEFESIEQVCMNPGIPTCTLCIFNGRTYSDGHTPWCKPEEKAAKLALVEVTQ